LVVVGQHAPQLSAPIDVRAGVGAATLRQQQAVSLAAAVDEQDSGVLAACGHLEAATTHLANKVEDVAAGSVHGFFFVVLVFVAAGGVSVTPAAAAAAYCPRLL
jgi:hypothetical protein